MRALFVFCCLFSQVALAAKIHIKIKLTGVKDGMVIYLQDETYTDSTYFRNGKADFTFNQKNAEPTQIALYTEDKTCRMAPFAENQDLTISGTWGQDPMGFVYTGSKTTNELFTYLKAKEPETKAINLLLKDQVRQLNGLKGFSSELTKFKKDSINQVTQKKRDSIDLVVIEKEMAFTAQYPYSYLTASLPDFAYRDRKIDKQGALKWFNTFPYETKSSKAGKAFLTAINKYNILHKGDTAPEIALLDINKKPIKLSQFNDKNVVLVFWASWCAPCRAEVPRLKQIQMANPNVQMISFSFDDNDALWRKAVKESGISWINISDLKGFATSDIALKYGVSAIPAVFYIKKGIISDERLNVYGVNILP